MRPEDQAKKHETANPAEPLVDKTSAPEAPDPDMELLIDPDSDVSEPLGPPEPDPEIGRTGLEPEASGSEALIDPLVPASIVEGPPPRIGLVGSAPGVGERELPRYKCHKVVYALEIGAIFRNFDNSATITPVEPGYAEFRVDADYVRNHDPFQGDGYYVVYSNGYKSWSPKDTFEAGYTRILAVDWCDPDAPV